MELTPDHIHLMESWVVLERQKRPLLSYSIAAELLSRKNSVGAETTLVLAESARQIGLREEFFDKMKSQLKSAKPAIKEIAQKSLILHDQPGDPSTAQLINQTFANQTLPASENGNFEINRAQDALKNSKLSLAQEVLANLPETSPRWSDAQYILAVISYQAGQLDEALLTTTELLQGKTSKSLDEASLVSKTNLLQARLYFQKGEYAKAYQSYLKVDKKDPEIVQAMMEQAWTQILSQDYEGAAGNMFTLHTEFFKASFAPESYVARTISYLNLCQFGDGLRVLNDLKTRYTPLQKQMQQYSENYLKSNDPLETVKRFFADQNQKEIHGLPRSFVWTWARNPEFRKLQGNLNTLEAEVKRHSEVALEILDIEKKILAEQTKIRDLLSEASQKKQPLSEDSKAQLEADLVSLKLQYELARQSRAATKDLRAKALARLESQKTEGKKLISSSLKRKFTDLKNVLDQTLDQTEVLAYEIYSGAGEHLRYQAAGGEIEIKSVNGLKPANHKQIKWEFRGEVWEDELGHYRSSLKNVCPTNVGQN